MRRKDLESQAAGCPLLTNATFALFGVGSYATEQERHLL